MTFSPDIDFSRSLSARQTLRRLLLSGVSRVSVDVLIIDCASIVPWGDHTCAFENVATNMKFDCLP